MEQKLTICLRCFLTENKDTDQENQWRIFNFVDLSSRASTIRGLIGYSQVVLGFWTPS